MTTPLLLPLEVGWHGPPWAGGDALFLGGGMPPFVPLLGVGMFCLFLVLLAVTVFFLVRSGRVGPPPWVQSRAPETEAKRVLAERFARGDITTDEFMERASVLNWTPGTDPFEGFRPRKKR